MESNIKRNVIVFFTITLQRRFPLIRSTLTVIKDPWPYRSKPVLHGHVFHDSFVLTCFPWRAVQVELLLFLIFWASGFVGGFGILIFEGLWYIRYNIDHRTGTLSLNQWFSRLWCLFTPYSSDRPLFAPSRDLHVTYYWSNQTQAAVSECMLPSVGDVNLPSDTVVSEILFKYCLHKILFKNKGWNDTRDLITFTP